MKSLVGHIPYGAFPERGKANLPFFQALLIPPPSVSKPSKTLPVWPLKQPWCVRLAESKHKEPEA